VTKKKHQRPEVPLPPHPEERSEALPWQTPKPPGEDRNLFWYAESADDIWEGIMCWHETNGEPL